MDFEKTASVVRDFFSRSAVELPSISAEVQNVCKKMINDQLDEDEFSVMWKGISESSPLENWKLESDNKLAAWLIWYCIQIEHERSRVNPFEKIVEEGEGEFATSFHILVLYQLQLFSDGQEAFLELSFDDRWNRWKVLEVKSNFDRIIWIHESCSSAAQSRGIQQEAALMLRLFRENKIQPQKDESQTWSDWITPKKLRNLLGVGTTASAHYG